MSPQNFNLLMHLILAAIYLPLLVTLINRHAGQETAAMILGGYVTLALLLVIGEGLWRGGQLYIASEQIANDFQVYGALALSFILVLAIVSFTRRESTIWLGMGLFWMLGFLVIVSNIFRF